jgi:hypothetical protein
MLCRVRSQFLEMLHVDVANELPIAMPSFFLKNLSSTCGSQTNIQQFHNGLACKADQCCVYYWWLTGVHQLVHTLVRRLPLKLLRVSRDWVVTDFNNYRKLYEFLTNDSDFPACGLEFYGENQLGHSIGNYYSLLYMGVTDLVCWIDLWQNISPQIVS